MNTDVDWDTHSITDNDSLLETGESQVTENQDATQAEEDTRTIAPSSAGTSLRGHMCTMSQRMADSVSQRDFYGTRNMHYMAQQSTIGETPEGLFHNAHLERQESMTNPIAFHAEMMGDIMYLQQALLFVGTVIKEINGHVENKNWELVH
jgi:hypothetical protein